MAPSTSTDESPDDAPRPDVDVRFALGVYAGVLVMSGIVLAGIVAGTDGADRIYPLAIGGFAVGAVVAGVAAGHWHGGPERVGGSVARAGVLVPAVAILVVGAAGVPLGSPLQVLVGLIAGGAALLTGGIVMGMTRTRYIIARFGPATPAAVWRAETAPAAKRRRIALAGVVFCSALAGVPLGILLGTDSLSMLPMFGGVGAAAAGSTIRSETFRAHESGLEIDAPLGRRFVPWSQFDGYRLTETELRLHRSLWVDYRCDREAIADVDAVTAVLDRHLSSA